MTVACPPTLRRPITLETHTAAHLGEYKTVKTLQLNWFWPGMQSEVRRIVRTCESCQSNKSQGLKTPATSHHLYAGRAWQKVAIDFTGPLEVTERGNKWILVLTDHFTRWSEALPLPDATASTVASVLSDTVFSRFGIPEEIHSDQGRQFESELMHELCKLWKCDKSRTAPYRPMANGVVERLNRTLASCIRTLLSDDDNLMTDDWDLLLPHIMSVIRASPHRVTGETANFLMLGREVRLPSTVTHDITEDGIEFTSEFAQALQGRMKQAHILLRKQQLEARVDDSEEPSLFKAGDSVWLKSYKVPRGKSAKLQAKFVGPYLIVEALPYHTYRLRRNGKDTIQHEGRIKLHYSEETPVQAILPRDGPRGEDNPKKKITSKALDAKTKPQQQGPLYGGGGSLPPSRPVPVAINNDPNFTLEIESLPNASPRREIITPTPVQKAITAPESNSEVTVTQKGVWGTPPQGATPASTPDFPPLGDQVGRSSRPGRMRSAPMHLKDFITE